MIQAPENVCLEVTRVYLVPTLQTVHQRDALQMALVALAVQGRFASVLMIVLNIIVILFPANASSVATPSPHAPWTLTV